MDNLQILKRIDAFIDRYYRNQIIKGLLYTIMLIAIIVLSIAVLEYLTWFSGRTRAFLFVGAIIGFVFILYYFLLISILRFLRLLKGITNRDACFLISQNFPELNDNLINIVELQQSSYSNINANLIEAAILQKSQIVSKVNFTSAAKIKKIRPIIYFLSVLVLSYIVIFFSIPELLSESTNRIVHFNQEFYRHLNYDISIDTADLYVDKGEDLDFEITIFGKERPNELFLYLGSDKLIAEKVSNSVYNVNFRNVNSEFSFRVGNGDFKTELFKINVLKPPVLISLTVETVFPGYMSKLNETLKNITTFDVPEGTILKYKLNTILAQQLYFKIDSTVIYAIERNNMFEFEQEAIKDFVYDIYAVNNQMIKQLVANSTVTVIADVYPEIDYVQIPDNENINLIHFKGQIIDDYGFTTLFFVVGNKKFSVPINRATNNQQYFFSYDFSDSKVRSSICYFEIFDNDGVNGPKSTKSKSFEIQFPNFEELKITAEKDAEELYNNLEKSLLMIKELEKDLQLMKNRLVSEKMSDFEKTELLKQMGEKQNQLQALINQAVNKNNKINNSNNSFQKSSEEILNKQSQIDEMLNKLMDDEMRDLLAQIDSLSKTLQNNDLLKDLDKLQSNYKNLSEQLDKNLELLKRYEVENNIEQLGNQLNKLSEDLKKTDEIQDAGEQDSVLNRLVQENEFLKSSYSDVQKKNDDLLKKFELKNYDNEFSELDSLMKNEFDNNDFENENNLKEGSDKAKELSNELLSMINNNRIEESGENAEALRQILENLIYFSFHQESLNDEMNGTSTQSAYFSNLIKQQQNANTVFQIIKDSLLALSKRTPYLGNHISDKIYTIQELQININTVLSSEYGTKPNLEQRRVLEYTNDLILLLSESLKNMENMGGSGNGAKTKSKPKSKPSLGEMRKSQEGLKSQLEQMLNEMKQKGGKGSKPGSQQLGNMLSQQEIFQKMINDMQGQSGLGKDILKQLEEIGRINEQNRKDIINNQISENTLLRQQQIVTRLLESEKAEMERDLDDKRESKEGNNFIKGNSNKMFDVEPNTINFEEILYKNTLKLNYYYKNKYQEYILNLN